MGDFIIPNCILASKLVLEFLENNKDFCSAMSVSTKMWKLRYDGDLWQNRILLWQTLSKHQDNNLTFKENYIINNQKEFNEISLRCALGVLCIDESKKQYPKYKFLKHPLLIKRYSNEHICCQTYLGLIRLGYKKFAKNVFLYIGKNYDYIRQNSECYAHLSVTFLLKLFEILPNKLSESILYIEFKKLCRILHVLKQKKYILPTRIITNCIKILLQNAKKSIKIELFLDYFNLTNECKKRIVTFIYSRCQYYTTYNDMINLILYYNIPININHILKCTSSEIKINYQLLNKLLIHYKITKDKINDDNIDIYITIVLNIMTI